MPPIFRTNAQDSFSATKLLYFGRHAVEAALIPLQSNSPSNSSRRSRPYRIRPRESCFTNCSHVVVVIPIHALTLTTSTHSGALTDAYPPTITSTKQVTPAALTDGTGALVERIAYSPYGTIRYRQTNFDTPFLFNGHYGVMTDSNGLISMHLLIPRREPQT